MSTTITPMDLSTEDGTALDYGGAIGVALSAYAGAQATGTDRIVVTVGPITPPNSNNTMFMRTAADASNGPPGAVPEGTLVPSRICVEGGSCTADPCFGGSPPPPPKTASSATGATGAVTDLVFPSDGLSFFKQTMLLKNGTLGPVVVLDAADTTDIKAVKDALETWFGDNVAPAPGVTWHLHVYRVVTVAGTNEIAPGDCLAIPVKPGPATEHDLAHPTPPEDRVRPFAMSVPADESELDYGKGATPIVISAHTDSQRPDADHFVVRVGPIDANATPPAEGTAVPSRICVVKGICTVDPCFGGEPPPPPKQAQSLGSDPPPPPPRVTDLLFSSSGVEAAADGLRWPDPGVGPVLRILADDAPDLDGVKHHMNAWAAENGLLGRPYHFHVYRVVGVEGTPLFAAGDCLAIPIVLADDQEAHVHRTTPLA